MKQICITIFKVNKITERSRMAGSAQQATHLWWHVLIKTLVSMPLKTADDAKAQLVDECKLYYKNNEDKQKKIKEF
ncbi:unnamed protein product [Didymodactylos carnosus]|uniref:Uncharacterized protein n=1 Tax=Didymodactylos carnosus TaxID=1234261 RepID=A0A815NC97_9BILA|nr:unnamed protein product [Didymodactylos carnosus]CAF4312868.1 unnamed protein product [Didymodactylos carnosus]